MKKIILLGIGLCLFFACNQQEKPSISLYYWKTIFALSVTEENFLKENQVKKLYIRYFDIDVNQKTQLPFPRTPIRFEVTPKNIEIIPVVYIKNEVMLNKKLDITDLAQKTNDYINQINLKNQIQIREIQIDCDWTLESRDTYMRFIETFKKNSARKLSATIRLHQIKYFKKTFIPNVDQGVLMYYNMGKIAPDSLNSIYDRNIANRYLASLQKYPLDINIAVPIYSWGIHIRDGKVIGLRNKIDISQIKNNSSFVLTKKNSFLVKNSTYKNGVFYKKNDWLKLESISQNDLLEMANDLENNINQNPKEIIFYDLDEFNIRNYEKDIFKKVIDCF